MTNTVSSHVNGEDDRGKQDLEIQVNALVLKVINFWHCADLVLGMFTLI